MKLNEKETEANSNMNASEIVNSSLVVKNLQQRSLKEILAELGDRVPAAETNVIDRAAEAVGIKQNILVEKTVTIDRPAEELYDYWRDFTNLPNFMGHLKAVTNKDEAGKVTHWVANAPLDLNVEWDAELVRDEPNHLIAWSALDADIDNCGFVRFQPATGDRGTQVKVVLEYQPPGGALTDAIASLFGESPQEQIGDELNRFKQLMETGEIATTEGQPQGS